MLPDWLTKLAETPALWLPATALVLALSIHQLVTRLVPLITTRKRNFVSISDEYDTPQIKVHVLSREFRDKFEERGREQYRIVQELQKAVGKIESLQRDLGVLRNEVDEMDDKIDVGAERHYQLREDVANMRGQLTEIQNGVSDLRQQIGDLRVPISEMARWVMMRARRGPPTPDPSE